MRLSLFALALLAFAAPAAAAESAWQSIAPGVSIRLISTGQVDRSGRTMVALEIDMPEDTKTYWRVPGETGLPLELDLSGSFGISGSQVLWPFPVREEKDSYLDYVYYGHTVLPVEVDAADPDATIDVQATLGVCSDICIPAQAHLSLPLLDTAADRSSALRIKQALAEVPIQWDQASQPIGKVFVAGEDEVAVEVDAETMDAKSLIAATADGETLFGLPQKSPQPGLVLLPILGKSDNSALDGTEVEITFMTDRGAYVVRRTIQAPDEASSAVSASMAPD